VLVAVARLGRESLNLSRFFSRAKIRSHDNEKNQNHVGDAFADSHAPNALCFINAVTAKDCAG
jgi:hypothetical protein